MLTYNQHNYTSIYMYRDLPDEAALPDVRRRDLEVPRTRFQLWSWRNRIKHI